MPWFTATDTVILWSTPPVQVQIFSHLSVHYGIWQVLIFIPCRWGKPINIQGSSFLCWSKTITNMNVSFFLLPFLFSFFFCTTTKHSKAPLRKAQSRISLHTFQTTMMIWDRSVRCNHLSSDPMSPSFYHCQNQSSAFHSQKYKCLTFFLGRVSKNFFFLFFFPMLHRKHKWAQCVLSCTFMEMWTLHPVEYIVMVFHHQKIVLSSPLPSFWSS